MTARLVISEHHQLGGLGDDDHVQYLLIDGTRAMTGDLEISKVAPAILFTDLGGATADEDWSITVAGHSMTITNIDSLLNGYLNLDHIVNVRPNPRMPIPVFTGEFAMIHNPTVNNNAAADASYFFLRDQPTINLAGSYSSYGCIAEEGTVTGQSTTSLEAIYLFVNHMTCTATAGNYPPNVHSFDSRPLITADNITIGPMPEVAALTDWANIQTANNGVISVTKWVTIRATSFDPLYHRIDSSGALSSIIVTDRIGFEFGNVTKGAGGGTEQITNIYGLKFDKLTCGTTINCGIWLGGASGATNNYGIVLADDGVGAGIWFGASQDVQMYYSGSNFILNTDLQSPSDFTIDCGTDKTVELVETVWDDIRIVPGAFDFAGANDPTLENYQPTGSGTTFKVWKFKEDDEIFFTVQLPHTYKEGTDIRGHVHWTPCDRGTAESGNTVDWRLDYSWANIDGTFPASGTIQMPDTCDGTDDKHQATASVAISGAGKAVSSMLICRLYRDPTNDTWVGTSATQSPALLEFDFHFEVNTVGSRQELTK